MNPRRRAYGSERSALRFAPARARRAPQCAPGRWWQRRPGRGPRCSGCTCRVEISPKSGSEGLDVRYAGPSRPARPSVSGDPGGPVLAVRLVGRSSVGSTRCPAPGTDGPAHRKRYHPRRVVRLERDGSAPSRHPAPGRRIPASGGMLVGRHDGARSDTPASQQHRSNRLHSFSRSAAESGSELPPASDVEGGHSPPSPVPPPSCHLSSVPSSGCPGRRLGRVRPHRAVWHITWSVNSVTHLWGYRNFDTHDNSRNNWLVGLVSNGEGWHNNHHAEPRSAAHGIAGFERGRLLMTISGCGNTWAWHGTSSSRGP